MNKFKSFVLDKRFLAGLAVGAVVGVAYLVKSALARKAVSKLPGSATAAG